MLEHDTFALRALIRRMERENAIGLVAFFVGVAGLLWMVRADFTLGEQAVLGFIAYLGGAILHQVRQARLDVVRSSLRQVLIAKDPSILTDPDW